MVQQALPVTMEVKQRVDVPNLSIVLSIDRSDSMTTLANGKVTYLDLAKEAAHLVIDLIDENSEVGIMSWDHEWKWEVTLRQAKNKEQLHNAIASIVSGGGTEGFPALREAHAALSGRPALLKHVIFLTDGQMRRDQFQDLVERMARDQITVSSVAVGKIKLAQARGQKIPKGWVVTKDGELTDDPHGYNNGGALLPLGGTEGYKGYGLSMIIGLLAGTLNGAANGRDVVDFNVDNTTPTNTGHVIVAINVAMFQPVAEFKQSVDAFVRDIRNSQRLPGVDAIRLPGEGSHARLEESLKLGAPLSAPLLKSLNDLAAELKIPALR